jgi:zinc protease
MSFYGAVLRKFMLFRILSILFIFVPLISNANIAQFRLKNGLDIIVKQDRGAPVVMSTLWYRVGGSYEHSGITGVSHVLEHMMFQGTKKVPAAEFSQQIENIGGELNAITSRDFTEYYEEVASNHVALCFRLEADRMHNLIIDNVRFKRELKVVKEERSMRVDDNPLARTYERLKALSFVNNPYHHPVVGWPTDLDSINWKDAENWYHSWYMPNNAILIVVGDIAPKKVFKLASQYFGALKPGVLPVLKPRHEAKPVGEKQIDVILPGKQKAIFLAYQAPSLKSSGHSKWKAYALAVLSEILGGSNSSRLDKDLVREQHLASSVYTDYDFITLHAGLLVISAYPPDNVNLLKLQKAILLEVNKLKTGLVSKQELNRVKAMVVANKTYSLDSLPKQARELGLYAVAGLSVSEYTSYVDNINKVSAKQIESVAREFLNKNNLSIARYVPAKKKEVLQ